MSNRSRQREILVGALAGASDIDGAAFIVVDIGEPWGFGLIADAVSGTTPTLNVTIESSMDDGVTWTPIDSFTEVTTTDQSEIKRQTVPLGTLVRAVAAFGGTSPVYNFKVYSLGLLSVRS